MAKEHVTLLPTVTMKGPAGLVVCNKDPREIANWRSRGYNIVANGPSGNGLSIPIVVEVEPDQTGAVEIETGDTETELEEVDVAAVDAALEDAPAEELEATEAAPEIVEEAAPVAAPVAAVAKPAKPKPVAKAK